MRRILVVFGTRPEAIKMAPLVKLLEEHSRFSVSVCVTAQHREMLDQVLAVFNIRPDFDLDLMSADQKLEDLSSKILVGVSKIIRQNDPDLVLVHGDTTTTLMATLAAFYCGVPVGHVEAGLRTGNLYSPWPEEANRVLAGTLARWHFAPTPQAKKNLLSEGISEDNIAVTGNTVVDGLFHVLNRIQIDVKAQEELQEQFAMLKTDRKLVLITGHRRENLGGGLERICTALSALAEKHRDVDFVYPVHLNPNVKRVVDVMLSDRENVYLLEPLEYKPFIFLMNKSYLILTDSGGMQEEAPSLGKPVLVMRDETERPEAVEAGTVKLVGTNPVLIEEWVDKLLLSRDSYNKMSRAHNPYGDGKACYRIVDKLEEWLK